MEKKAIRTKSAPSSVGPYSQAVKVGNFVFVSGQVGVDKGGNVKKGIREQTRQTLKNVKAILQEANLDLEDIVKTTVYLSDMNNFGEMNSVYREYFKKDPPARACIQAGLFKNFMVEIEAVASKLGE